MGKGTGKVVAPPPWQWSQPQQMKGGGEKGIGKDWKGAGKDGGKERRFIKTKICNDWERFNGNCQRGDSCTFAHGQQEIGQPIRHELHNRVQNTDKKIKIKICTNWVNGSCPR